MQQYLQHQEAQRITMLGMVKNILLSLIKIFFGIIGHSQALLADGIHSASDVVTDVLVLVAAKYGSKHADIDHPYGHKRIETAATVALAALLMITGAAIIFDAAQNFLTGNIVAPKMIVLWVALGSVILNEIIFRLTKKVAKKIHSNLLTANAWHHRSDAASSLVVATGVIGTLVGYPFADALAALIVGLMIIKMGAGLGWSSIQELVDTGVDEATLKKMQQIIRIIPGVKAIHQLRTRSMGGAIFVDLHLQVSPTISVSEGHYIAQQAHFKLIAEIAAIDDVTVHIDPENDEIVAPSKDLPNRDDLVAVLNQCWLDIPASKHIQQIILHYLAGEIQVELKMPWSVLATAETPLALQQLFQEAVKNLKEVSGVEVWFS